MTVTGTIHGNNHDVFLRLVVIKMVVDEPTHLVDRRKVDVGTDMVYGIHMGLFGSASGCERDSS